MPTPSPISFRDPDGWVFFEEGRILRQIQGGGVKNFDLFFESSICHQLIKEELLVQTKKSSRPSFDPSGILLEHQVVPFVSYPHEWSPLMLHEAGKLTLKLSTRLLHEGFGLKDATPHNILFKGSQPIFIDWLSFEKRNPFAPLWKANAQFERNFLYPLLANTRFGIPLKQIFTSHRDGLSPEFIYHLSGPLQRLSPLFLSLVTLPTLLSRKETPTFIYSSQAIKNSEKALFILKRTYRRLEKILKKIKPAKTSSHWTGYTVSAFHYPDGSLAFKESCIQKWLEEFRPQWVLDVGCNTGQFSLLAAKTGAKVVAIDSDEAVIDRLWHTSNREKKEILPLVIDLARPSPALGWNNQEISSFLSRSDRFFDMVLMLAVVHHLLVDARIPLSEIIRFAAERTTRLAVIEYVGPDDPMFQKIARGREALHSDLTSASFEDALRNYFDIVRCEPIPGTGRKLYLLEKKSE